jgi:hypothetical protein
MDIEEEIIDYTHQYIFRPEVYFFLLIQRLIWHNDIELWREHRNGIVKWTGFPKWGPDDEN